MTTLALLIAAFTIGAPASAISVTGEVTYEVDGIVTVVKRFDEIPERATITTGRNSALSLRFKSGSMIRLADLTQIQLTELVHGAIAGKRKEQIKLLTGKMWARIMKLLGQNSHFEIITRHAAAGVRGTAFWAQASNQDTTFVLDHGQIVINSTNGANQTLSERGAQASIASNGTSRTSTLDPQAVEQLRFTINGAASSMVQDFRDMRSGIRAEQNARGATRNLLQNPDQFTETELEAQRAGDTRRGRVMEDKAIVTVDFDFKP